MIFRVKNKKKKNKNAWIDEILHDLFKKKMY